MSFRRRALAAFGFLLLLCSAAGLAFGPWVRAQADARAQRYGASLSIGSVRPAWLGVRLADVTVTVPELPFLSVHIDSVSVDSDRSVHAAGGQVVVHGPVAEAEAQLASWRAAHTREGASEGTSAGSRVIEVSGLQITWDEPFGPGTLVRASGVAAPDLRRPRSVRVAEFEVRNGRYSVKGHGLEVDGGLGDGSRLQMVRAGDVRAEVSWADADPPAPPAPSATEPEPHGVGGGAGGKAAGEPGSDFAGWSGRLHQWKEKLSATVRSAGRFAQEDARVEVGALEVQLQRKGDRLTLGPGPFLASRKDGVFLASLAPGTDGGQSGVTFRIEMPLQGGDVRFDVVGGPISLATLGVHEGDLGLARVGDTSLQVNLHIVAKADGESVQFEGNLHAQGLNIAHSKLAEGTVEGLAVAAKVKGQVRTDGTHLELEDSEFDVGAVQLELSGRLGRVPDVSVDVRFGIPMVSCQAFLDALPAALIPVVKGMSAAGTLSLKGRLRFDPSKPGDYLLDYQAANDCRITSVPASVDVSRFRGPFRRKVYDPSGKLVEVESGPGTPGWVSLGGMSRFLEVAVMTTEDSHFRTHRGFDHEAIRNSVRENLTKRKFVRGASTISMQLAKNLYLDRRKTVSRKLQELILTAYLEQALTKDQILELYLNAIEFGPMIYGVGPAAYHYFHTSPGSLSLGQALYLSSILPNPSQQHFGEGGRVSDGWMGYLHKLMKNAERRRWIDSEELEAGLGEWVVYGSPEPIRTTPAGTGEPGDPGEDPEWQDDGLR